MKLGIFSMPSHPPERSLKDGHEWDLQNIIWADELGFEEFWIGEHHAMVWEPHPAPDMLVLEGLRQTKRIRLGPGGFCLPYHHPAELANRIAMLDHLSGGRLNIGFAASGSPTDWEMFGVDGMHGEHRDMTRESIDIIMNLWTQEPGWTYAGKYWKAAVPHNPTAPEATYPAAAAAASPHWRGRVVVALADPGDGGRTRLAAHEPELESQLREKSLGFLCRRCRPRRTCGQSS